MPTNGGDMAQQFYKIRGRTLDDAYRQMHKRFGNEAVVLNTRQVTEGGVLGFFGTRHVEITASVPRKPQPGRLRTPSAAERRYAEQSTLPQAESAAASGRSMDELQELVRAAQRRMNGDEKPMPREEMPTPQVVQGEGSAAMLPFPQPKPGEGDTEDVRKELGEIRELLQVLYTEHPGAGLPVEFAPHYRTLTGRGVSRKSAATLIGGALRDSDLSVMRDPRVFSERLRVEIRKAIRTTGGMALAADTCRVVALCGPTGVGKTTTVAKLAAYFAVKERARVALVTADTYRVAAADQLRVYANIIGLPLTVVNDAKEMHRAMQVHRDFDLVLVDTAGGSQFNLDHVNDLKQMLAATGAHETVLVASAGTPLGDLQSVAGNFKCVNPTSLLFTKLDETRQYGTIFSLAVETGLPLSYLSVGQAVPEDLRLATPDAVASLLLEGKLSHE